MRNEQRTVRVAVVGYSEIRAHFEHFRAQRLQVLGSAVQIDIAAVRRAMDAFDPSPQSFQESRSEIASRAVRSVYRDSHPIDAAGQGLRQMIEVGAIQIRVGG